MPCQHFDIYHDCMRRVEALREHHKESDDSSHNPHSEYEGQAHKHLESQKKQVQSNQHAHELQSPEPRPRCRLITLVRFCQVCFLYWTLRVNNCNNMCCAYRIFLFWHQQRANWPQNTIQPSTRNCRTPNTKSPQPRATSHVTWSQHSPRCNAVHDQHARLGDCSHRVLLHLLQQRRHVCTLTHDRTLPPRNKQRDATQLHRRQHQIHQLQQSAVNQSCTAAG